MTVYYKRDASGGTNWNDNTSWSTVGSTSSTNTGTYPTSADTANFDANSNACTVNVTSVVAYLNMTGYNNTLTYNATLQTSAQFTMPSGAGGALAGTYAHILAGTQTVTSNGKTLPALTFNYASQSITMSGNLVVTGLVTVTLAVTLNGAYTLSCSNGLALNANFNSGGTGTLSILAGTVSGSGSILSPMSWTGSGAISFTGGVVLSNLNHTSYTGTFTIGSGVMPTVACITGYHVVLNASATYASGGAGASLRFGGSVAHNITTNGVVLPYDISMNTGNVRTLLDNWTLNSGNQLTALTSAGTWNGYKIIIKGQFNTSAGFSGTTVLEFQTGTTIAGGAGGSSSPMVFNGNVTWSGSLAVGGSWNITYTSGTVTATSGTLSIISSGGTLNIGNNFVIGTINTASTGNPTNITLSSNVYCTNISGGSNTYLHFNSLTYKVYVNGSLPTSNVVTLAGTATYVMKGTGSINNSSLSISCILQIDAETGTISIGAMIMRLTLKYISGNITNISNTGYIGCYSGVTLDIANIPTRIEVRALTTSAITLASNLVCGILSAGNSAVTLNFSGSFDVDCTWVYIQTNSAIYIPSGQKLTVSTGFKIFATTSTIPSLRALSAPNMKLVYNGTYANMIICQASLVNIDASLSPMPIFCWCPSAITSCTNVYGVNGGDIGGGGVTITHNV